MAKPKTTDRILKVLAPVGGRSNGRIKVELNLSDDAYEKARRELLDDKLIEKYRCQGGGVQLTSKGAKLAPSLSNDGSGVEKEIDLYEKMILDLESQIASDERSAIVLNTHALKLPGQWQNPDIVTIEVEKLEFLRKTTVKVTTFEVKQFPRWKLDCVFEAASHHRFAHEALVILEWPNDVEFSQSSSQYRLEEVARECRRFGVGIGSLSQHYGKYRFKMQLEPTPMQPSDIDVNGFLSQLFERMPAKKDEFEALFK